VAAYWKPDSPDDQPLFNNDGNAIVPSSSTPQDAIPPPQALALPSRPPGDCHSTIQRPPVPSVPCSNAALRSSLSPRATSASFRRQQLHRMWTHRPKTTSPCAHDLRHSRVSNFSPKVSGFRQATRSRRGTDKPFLRHGTTAALQKRETQQGSCGAAQVPRKSCCSSARCSHPRDGPSPGLLRASRRCTRRASLPIVLPPTSAVTPIHSQDLKRTAPRTCGSPADPREEPSAPAGDA